MDLVQSVHNYHEWFLCNVPSDQSIHVAWNSLVQILPVRDMKLHRCLGCNLFTHVTNYAPSRMLINKDLLVKSSTRQRERFSSIVFDSFRMIPQLMRYIKIRVIRKLPKLFFQPELIAQTWHDYQVHKVQFFDVVYFFDR